MKFSYPLGLLGLIGIPLVIIIYILKNKYQEKIISSNYIWKLSEKFLKKKNPINKINNLFNLIIELFAILFISIGIAHPIITIKDNAKNYLFILDSSASMNIENASITRFEKGKNEIKKILNEAKNGSYYSLIYASDNSSLLLDKETDKDKVLNIVDNLEVSTKSFSLDNAINLCQDLYLNDSSYTIYVITDANYLKLENVNLINVSSEEDYNFLINDVIASYNNDNYLEINGSLISYGKDENINLSLYVDDIHIQTQDIAINSNNEIQFNFQTTLENYQKIELKINNNDSLALDNNYILYSNESNKEFNTLLVSDNPTFLKSILKTLGNKQIKVITTSEYESIDATNYSLYIFDSFSPTKLPSDGTIWLFGTSENIENANFTRQKEITLSKGAKLSLSNSNDTTYKMLTKEINGNEIYISKYQKYSVYSSFSTIYEYNGDPIIFVGNNNYNNHEVVFAFDLHDSNFPLLIDYIILFKNLINYSIPTMIEDFIYECGDNLNINVLPLTEIIRINYPNSYSKYLELNNSLISHSLDVIGTYNIEATINNNQKEFNIYVKFPKNESEVNITLSSIEVFGQTSNETYDENYDSQIIILCLIFAFLLLDWGIYIYENH